jgi:hypothetical protein
MFGAYFSPSYAATATKTDARPRAPHEPVALSAARRVAAFCLHLSACARVYNRLSLSLTLSHSRKDGFIAAALGGLCATGGSEPPRLDQGGLVVGELGRAGRHRGSLQRHLQIVVHICILWSKERHRNARLARTARAANAMRVV